MGLALSVKHAPRYRDIAWLLMKYGRSDVVKHAGLHALVKNEAIQEGTPPAEAASLADDLEKMGPTFIKLGQLLSTRPDLLPAAYLDALARLQDKVEPFSFAEVEKTVTQELGVRLSKAFAEFEAEPLAAASLGQVHRAWLRDGRAVAVKIQRPDIREMISDDLDAFGEVAAFLDQNTEIGRKYEFGGIVEELRKSLLNELDYREEARNLQTLHDNLAEFDRIIVPLPINDYTTSRVLTMEYVKGKKITAISPLRQLELDGYELADQLFRAYLKQMLIDGFFHADPHPGNVFLTDDDRISLLDLGMVSRITETTRDRFLKLILAISEGRGDAAARTTLQICEPKENADPATFQRHVADLVARQVGVSLQQIKAGPVLLSIRKIAADCGYRLPPEMTLVGKALLNLDQVGHTLAPDFDPNESIRRNAALLTQQKLRSSFTWGNFFGSLLETKETIEQLPARVNTILDRLANNDVEIKIDAIDERTLIDGMQKIANRITTGLILAALIIGAAMLMDVPTSFRIFGYPGLAILLFTMAGGGGMALVISIFLNDINTRKK
jgi:predicted unusual protein kinase regulating ubiquinone biosynthesis (AarF/ABC1/UbiB family)